MASFDIHPRALADALANAVDIGKDKTTHGLVCLRASVDTLHVYGRGRYTAGKDSRRFKADLAQYAEIVITEDEASELATALRGVEGVGRKETTINVFIQERDRIKVQYGDDLLCDLPDADGLQLSYGEPDDLSDWDEIDEMLKEVAGNPPSYADRYSPPSGPLLTRFGFQKDILARMNKIRSDSPVMDIALHPNSHAVGIALGSNFRALVAGIDRQTFSTGGTWGDGPGKPEYLWEA